MTGGGGEAGEHYQVGAIDQLCFTIVEKVEFTSGHCIKTALQLESEH